MKNSVLMDEYMYINKEYSQHLYKFEIYHINKEISHSNCHFLHSGSCTWIPYFHILEINANYIKSSQTFFGQLARCADNKMQVQLAKCEKC